MHYARLVEGGRIKVTLSLARSSPPIYTPGTGGGGSRTHYTVIFYNNSHKFNMHTYADYIMHSDNIDL